MSRPLARPLKTCLLDIETFPALGWFWGRGMYDQQIIEVDRPWRMASFAYKWYGEKGVTLVSGQGRSERSLIKELWSVLDAAELVVAHHAKFDIGMALAKFAIYNLGPPSPYKVFCTYLTAKKFGFTSRSLEELCLAMHIGRKLSHHGKDTWLHAMRGDPRAWATICRYNVHDVSPLLEGVYERLKEFSGSHRVVISGIHPTERRRKERERKREYRKRNPGYCERARRRARELKAEKKGRRL